MADHKFTIKGGESVADFHSRLMAEYGCEGCGEFSNNGCGNWLIDGYMFDGDDTGFYDCGEAGAGPLGCMKDEKGGMMNDNGIAELMRQLEELKKENAALKRDVKRAEDGGFISNRSKKQ